LTPTPPLPPDAAEKVIVPLRLPPVDGVKATLTVQDAPPTSVVAPGMQSPVVPLWIANSLLSLLTLIALLVAPPVFVMVKL